MHYLHLILTLFILFSCKSADCEKNSEAKKENIVMEKVTKQCPDNGVCKLEVLENKYFEIATDNIGATYPKIKEGKSAVLKFTYTKNTNPEYQDSSYIEEVYIEFNPVNPELKISGKELKNANFLFARLCFCRGQTGYYPIDEGNVEITKIANKQYKLSVDFSTSKVPQKVTKIEEVFSLK